MTFSPFHDSDEEYRRELRDAGRGHLLGGIDFDEERDYWREHADELQEAQEEAENGAA